MQYIVNKTSGEIVYATIDNSKDLSEWDYIKSGTHEVTSLPDFSIPNNEKYKPEITDISPRQLRLSLLSLGIADESLMSMLDNIDNYNDREIAKIEYKYASVFKRSHPLIDVIGAQLGLSSDEIDTLFIQAKEL